MEYKKGYSRAHEWHKQVSDVLDSMVIRDNGLSLVTLKSGDIPIHQNHGYGLYYRDCRFLSGYTFRINGKHPKEILSSDEKGFSSTMMMTNTDLENGNGRAISKDTLSIRRDRIIPGCVEETIAIENFNEFEITGEIVLDFDSDFDDIFTVRGITKSTEGELYPPAYENGCLELSYLGKDSHLRKTKIYFSPFPDKVTGESCSFYYKIKPKESYRLGVRILVCEINESLNDKCSLKPTDDIVKEIKLSYLNTMECCSNIQTNNAIFNKIFMRSMSDLRMLQTSMSGERFYSAGVPWYDALFGRDSIISAIQALPYEPKVARSTLKLLALYQGKAKNEWNDEEPGKILHELRIGEKANTGEIPQSPYYGSVDSTPLFLLLLCEYIDWTGEIGLYYELNEQVNAAIGWLENSSNEKTKLLPYMTRSSFGLFNQGWKDSNDAISHSDGSLAIPPVYVAEVQGYAYLARKRMSRLFEMIGRKEDAARLMHDASIIQKNFNEIFWMDDRKFFAQAIDSSGICDVISSNPLHCLWVNIVDRRKAGHLVERIFHPDMFTGWGIRTLSSLEKRYNPLGYHTGTVWPHDNSIIAMGLNKYGFKEELSHLFTSMYEAAGYYPGYRLPELFGGYQREEYDIPIKYPVACSPQSWSSGTIPHMLTSSLGLVADALDGKLTMMKPHLPPWLTNVRINKLRLGNTSADIEFRRVGDSTLVNVMEKRGSLEVNVVY